MPPFSLDLRDAIMVITGIVTVTGVILAQRAGIAKLTDGQGEVLRQLGALHKRMDGYGERISGGEIAHAVLVERVKAMKESQRFRLATKQDMFAEDDQT